MANGSNNNGSTPLGSIFNIDETGIKEALGRDFSVFDAKQFRNKPSDVVEFETSTVSFGSDDEEIGMLYTAARKQTSVNLKFAGVMGHNKHLLPVTNSGATWDLVGFFWTQIQETIQRQDLDRPISQVLLAKYSNLNEMEFIEAEDKTGYVFRFTSKHVIEAWVYAQNTDVIEADPSVKNAKNGDRDKAIETIVNGIIAKQKITHVDIRDHLMFRAVDDVLTALENNTELNSKLQSAINSSAYSGLFYRINENVNKAVKLNAFVKMALDGKVSLPTGSIEKEVTKYRKVSELGKAFIQPDGRNKWAPVGVTPDATDQRAMMIERHMKDVLFLEEKDSDVWSRTFRKLKDKTAFMPDFYVNYQPWSVTSDKYMWMMQGYCIDAESIAARLFLWQFQVAIKKLALAMTRCDNVTVYLSDSKPRTSKQIFDVLYKMAGNGEFDPDLIKSWFINVENQEVDLRGVRRAFLIYRSMVLLDEMIESFATTEEIISQVPELWPGIYVINDYHSNLKVDGDHIYLYLRFKNNLDRIKPAITKIVTMCRKYIPRPEMFTENNFNIIEAMSAAGIVFASHFEIVNFGTFKGSIPMFIEGIPFGMPTVQPVLVAHLGYDKQAALDLANSVKTRSIYFESSIGTFSHVWTSDYTIIRGKDSFSPSDIPKEVKTYILFQGNMKLQSYALFTKINLKEYVYPDQYEGNAGIVFRQGP